MCEQRLNLGFIGKSERIHIIGPHGATVCGNRREASTFIEGAGQLRDVTCRMCMAHTLGVSHAGTVLSSALEWRMDEIRKEQQETDAGRAIAKEAERRYHVKRTRGSDGP